MLDDVAARYEPIMKQIARCIPMTKRSRLKSNGTIRVPYISVLGAPPVDSDTIDVCAAGEDGTPIRDHSARRRRTD